MADSVGILFLQAQRKKLNERIKLQHLALETQEVTTNTGSM